MSFEENCCTWAGQCAAPPPGVPGCRRAPQRAPGTRRDPPARAAAAAPVLYTFSTQSRFIHT